jgi:hypothetical protein
VLLLDYFEMLSKWFLHRCRKHRVSIFVAFARPDNYLIVSSHALPYSLKIISVVNGATDNADMLRQTLEN